MEKELNIAAILKDKPKGTKLWSPIFGECTFDEISCNNSCLGVDTNKRVPEIFYANGKYDENGECTIFPSKEMRDWEKFAWKKGDVLIGDCGFVCIFKEWASDDYTKFNGCYFDGMPNAETAKYSKLDNNTAYSYIREIENRCVGKLNLETLKIEKQLEFNDGDILYAEKDEEHVPVIFILNITKEGRFYYACLTLGDYILCDYKGLGHVGNAKFRLATEEEKKKLFDTLAIEGKAWDAERKKIVDLPKNCEFKPFDKVLVRDSESDKWRANSFGYISEDGYYCCVFSSWVYCIPYAGNEHLLGTTKDVEG